MSSPRLLLVTPGFHGYWRSIASALSRRGYAVTTHLYDHRTARGKVRHKVVHELPARMGLPRATDNRPTQAAVGRIAQERPDVLLVVKGDELGPDFWSAAAGIPRRALWLYDEIRRTSHSAATLEAAGPIASYSPADVEDLTNRGLEALHVPLGHDQHLAPTPVGPLEEVAFIGARYPKRESLLTTLHAAGVPVRAYGRDWSGHPLDRARTWRVGAPSLPAERDLDRESAYGVMAGATVSLNIHGDQDGFTMRTFEVPGVGGLELIDRREVSRYYEPGKELLTFDTGEQAIDLCRRAMVDRSWAQAIREAGRARTLAEHTMDHRAAALETLWA
ncbi:MAG: glycosyltransferase [Actinobacteria bacterium]|nr:glycosyltransferase [Actinomycetota bacterium]